MGCMPSLVRMSSPGSRTYLVTGFAARMLSPLFAARYLPSAAGGDYCCREGESGGSKFGCVGKQGDNVGRGEGVHSSVPFAESFR